MELITILILSVQTIIFAATFFAIYAQIKKQTEAHRLDLYHRSNENFRSLLYRVIENDELLVLMGRTEPNPKEMKAMFYFELILENFERIFFMANKGWIKSESWDEWETFLLRILRSEQMRKAFYNTEESLWPPFRERIKEIL